MKHFPFPIVNKDNSNCLDCYRCLRKCPLDAIEFSSGRARIITESCVVCGECIRECPQKTKRIISDMDFVVRALNEGKPLVLSIGEMGKRTTLASIILKKWMYWKRMLSMK